MSRRVLSNDPVIPAVTTYADFHPAVLQRILQYEWKDYLSIQCIHWEIACSVLAVRLPDAAVERVQSNDPVARLVRYFRQALQTSPAASVHTELSRAREDRSPKLPGETIFRHSRATEHRSLRLLCGGRVASFLGRLRLRSLLQY